MKVITLGTGSGVPTLRRNLACVALVRHGQVFLFDCGEAAQIQMRRARLRFSRVEAIFISHTHGDHLIGLMGILMSMEMENRSRPLRVFGPPGIQEYVSTLTRLHQTHINYDVRVRELEHSALVCDEPEYAVHCAPLEHRVFVLGYAFVEKDRPGEFNVEAAQRLGVPVGPLFGKLQRGERMILSDGTVVEPQQVLGPPRRGRKVVYCTDTRPCQNTIELARDADLLIHEGTFDHSRADDAWKKGHSTVVQAAEIAGAASVKRLLLTHVSPRYEDAAVLQQQAQGVFPNVLVAEDLMDVDVEPPM
jgi:ribonuclease Z